MTLPRVPQLRHVRYGVRYQARVDEETSATLEELARTFHRAGAAVLGSVLILRC